MLDKHSQAKSLLDYLMQIMPEVDLLELRRVAIPRTTNVAAKKLFTLWTDEDNKISNQTLRRPTTFSSEDANAMQREGLVKIDGDKLEITARGAEVIKTMILGDDKSAFEDDGKVLDYHIAQANLKPRRRVKTGAKKRFASSERRDAANWYKRMQWE